MPYARKELLTWHAGMYYHIYNRGVSKSTLFREPTNFLYTIKKIQKYRLEHQVSVIAYCLLPNHYHLLLRQDGEKSAGNLPQSVFNSYSKAYNLKYSHSGTLFEGRFRAKPVQTTSHLLHLCRYIHGNPVKDGLVTDPADWPWSNYLDWIGERNGTLVDREFIQTQFGSAADYQKSLFQYLHSLQAPEAVKRFLVDLER
jgi:REP element-mobilizing transposase RayT